LAGREAGTLVIEGSFENTPVRVALVARTFDLEDIPLYLWRQRRLPEGIKVGLVSFFAAFDEAELRGIADITGGRYFAVGSAERLMEVYRELQRQAVWKPQRTEVTAVFSLLAGMLVASSLLLSSWKRRVV
jgi:hypothetical protein